MKLLNTGLFLPVVCLLYATICTGTAFANNVHAQPVTDKKVTLNFEQTAISTVLTEIEKQTGVRIIYSPTAIRANRKLDVRVVNEKLGLVLEQTFRPLDIVYRVINGSLLLYDRTDTAAGSGNGAMADADPPVQQATVSGAVTATTGEPLPGVSVAVKGTTAGTTTDGSGKYTLSVPDPNATLVFSYIGYITQEIPLNGRSALNVQLAQETRSLSDVVVVGYGTRRVEDLTGAVANLQAVHSNRGGVSTSVDQMMAGRIAGVQFKENTAQPGGGGKTIIRGRNSLFLNTDPLYIIDGFIVNVPSPPPSDASFAAPDRNPMNSINPNDIESISVLKDAAATAIYGAKGSNGVVIITTKRGKKGPATLQYDGSYSFQRIARRFDMMDAGQYMNFWNGLGVTSFTPEQIANARTTNWFDAVTRTGAIQSHNLSISGATDDVNYFVSLGYFDHDGLVKNSGMQRINGRGNLQYTKDKFNFTTNIFATRLVDASQPSEGGTRSSIIASAIAFAPYVPIRDSTGAYSRDPRNDFIANPVSVLDIRDWLYTDKLNFSVSADYEIWKGLKPEIRVTYDVQNANRSFYVPSTTAYNGNFSHGGSGSQTSQQNIGYVLNGLLHYNGTFADKHHVTGLLGYEYYYRSTNMFLAQNAGFGTDVTGPDNLGGGQSPIVSSGKFDRKDISAFGRVDYDYDEKYLATATLRRDGSSVFGANNKWAWFPGLSLGWRLDKEHFLSGAKSIDILKLRAGYGQTGNSGIESYQSLAKYDLNTSSIIGQSPVVGAVLTPYRENPDLKWETTSQWNVGLDYGFFNRISGALDFFVKNTRNMLIQVQQSPFSGYEYQWQNAATMRTWGLEYSINTNNIRSGDFQWNSTLNFTWMNNKITGYNTGDPTTIAALNTIGVISGERTNSYYTWVADGVDPQTGSFRYKDINGDGAIDANDRVVAGNPDPRFMAGLGNTLSYKGVSLDFFFNSNFGNQLHNQTKAQYTVPNVQDISNYLVDAQDKWSEANPGSDIPANRANGGGSWIYNSRWIEDAWFIRLQNVNLSYTIPASVFKKAIAGARVYLQAQNLFVITDYSGMDPEAANNTFLEASENMPAFLPGSTDANAYPAARTFTVGLNVTFK